MKLNKLFLLAPVAVLSLTSCGKQVRYSEDKYVLHYNDAANAVEYADNANSSFNILQLSDIHFTYLADNEYHFKFIEKTIEAAKTAVASHNEELHLIVITGDTFTFATKDTIRDCCNFFEKQKIPWTITFGNHDEQGYFSVDWMTNYLTQLSKKKTSNLLFVDYPNDDVFGSANFVIDLYDENHKNVNRQIIMMDSNRYNYGEGMGYDYIHTDQIDWYERMYNYIKSTNAEGTSANNPTSLAFFHIPLSEFTDAYNKATANEQIKEKFVHKSDVFDGGEEPIKKNFLRDVRGEDESSPKINSHFLDRIIKTKNQGRLYTQGIFVGHDHINSYCVDYDVNEDGERDITFGYGIKATNTVYYDDAYLGGQIIRFSPKIKTDLVLHKYSEMEVK